MRKIFPILFLLISLTAFLLYRRPISKEDAFIYANQFTEKNFMKIGEPCWHNTYVCVPGVKDRIPCIYEIWLVKRSWGVYAEKINYVSLGKAKKPL